MNYFSSCLKLGGAGDHAYMVDKWPAAEIWPSCPIHSSFDPCFIGFPNFEKIFNFLKSYKILQGSPYICISLSFPKIKIIVLYSKLGSQHWYNNITETIVLTWIMQLFPNLTFFLWSSLIQYLTFNMFLVLRILYMNALHLYHFYSLACDSQFLLLQYHHFLLWDTPLEFMTFSSAIIIIKFMCMCVHAHAHTHKLNLSLLSLWIFHSSSFFSCYCDLGIFWQLVSCLISFGYQIFPFV